MKAKKLIKKILELKGVLSVTKCANENMLTVIFQNDKWDKKEDERLLKRLKYDLEAISRKNIKMTDEDIRKLQIDILRYE